ncbi:MAG TPA: hypothetical protein VNR38_04235 [Ureibacillus sp.]|nr:hypothetical protein [Ureibacillus sp.]
MNEFNRSLKANEVILLRREERMRIDDELLDKLGVYFVYHDIYNRYGITFETFVDRWMRGILDI